MRSTNKKFPKSKLIIAVSGVAIVLFIMGIVREKINSNKIDVEIAGLETQIKSFADENGQIGKFIGEWQGSNRVEKEARLKLGLKKPGENVVIIMRGGSSSTTQLIKADSEIVANFITNKEDGAKTNPGKWWNYFFNSNNL